MIFYILNGSESVYMSPFIMYYLALLYFIFCKVLCSDYI